MSLNDPRSSGSDYLLIYVPSMTGRDAPGGINNYDRFLSRLSSDVELEGWDFRVFEHHIKWWSTVSMEDVALRLAVAIRGWAGENQDGTGPRRIILMGHSIGGLLVRAAFLRDAGRGTANATDSSKHEWTDRVERVVLAAPPNAGFRRAQLQLAWYLEPLYTFVKASRSFTAEQLEAGADWITGLRMRWFDYFSGEEASIDSRPEVIQLLGDHDDLLLREDVLDIRYLANSSHLDVAGATHGNIVDLREAPDPDQRYYLLRRVIKGNAPDAEFAAAELRSSARVFFLLHGIRSQRYAGWVGALADELSSADSTSGVVAQSAVSLEKIPSAQRPQGQTIRQLIVKSPSYGYFNAMQFVSPFARRRQVRRFLDWYADLYTNYDPSNMYFAGHSNGTYMLGYALEHVREVRFRRIYLASSILPRAFPWTSIVRRGQLGGFEVGTWNYGSVHSERGTKDVPVGWLVSALNGLGMRDIGTGGFDGFDESVPELREHKTAFRGGHGAPFSPQSQNPSRDRVRRRATDRRHARERTREIASFLLTNVEDPEPEGITPSWFSAVARGSAVFSGPLVAVLGVAMAVALKRGNRRRRKYLVAALATVAWLIARAV